MNGRTCQLCGKALSRFGVGSGGDFCSREHRNQFRLRLGMDRLLEANKVASLMRRRENAKTIPAAQLVRAIPGVPRCAPSLRQSPRQPGIRSLGPGKIAMEARQLASHASAALAPRPCAPSARPLAPLDFTGSFAGNRTGAVLPAHAKRVPARTALAAAAAVRRGVARNSAMAPRIQSLGQFKARTTMGGQGIQLRALPPMARPSPEAQGARPLFGMADRGQALRISSGVGFRPPATRIREIALSGPCTTPLTYSPRPRGLHAGSPPPDAQARQAMLRITLPPPLIPAPPDRDSTVEFHWPTAMATDTAPADFAADAMRVCVTAWSVGTPLQPQPRFRPATHRFRRHDDPLAIPTPAAIPLNPELRVGLVSFEIRDTPFEYSPSAIHGTLMGGMQFPSQAARRIGAAPNALHEHFDAGWYNWLGCTDDWKVDAAGVRTGSLALYSPSVELADYDLEFLARIDNRSVNWVFRARNFDDYYQATLATAAGGGYEFTRHIVQGGAAQAPTAPPLLIPASGPATRTAVTVRLRAAGGEFTLSLDGKAVESWTDSRLPAGGIGFVSAPDDRARLYWVKVTPADPLSKEYRKQ